MFSHFHASVRFHVSCHSTRLAQLNYHPNGLHDDICRADDQQTALTRKNACYDECVHGDHLADDGAPPGYTPATHRPQRRAPRATTQQHAESLAWACTGRERCPSVASDGAAQPLHAIRTLACSRLAFSAPSLLSTRGRRGVSAASSGARKPDAGRSPTTRLCGAGGGRAGRATPGGADAPHSKSTRSYEVVVVNELEVHVEAWRWHEGASMVAAVRLGGATPRAPRGDHT